MDPAVRTLEDLALKWTLRHDANPVQTWCNDNVRIVMDAAGNRKFDKQKATGRIDGIVALAMAANLAMASKPQEPTYQMIFL
jgi:phage terminase large subunit-like protein